MFGLVNRVPVDVLRLANFRTFAKRNFSVQLGRMLVLLVYQKLSARDTLGIRDSVPTLLFRPSIVSIVASTARSSHTLLGLLSQSAGCRPGNTNPP